MNKDPRTHAVIGAAMEVHITMGPGHLEAVYQECFEIELELRTIPFTSKLKQKLECKGHVLSKYYIPDFKIYGEIIVEIKAQKLMRLRS